MVIVSRRTVTCQVSSYHRRSSYDLNVFNGLTAGPYQVVVKDGNSCLSSAQTVTVTAPLVVNFTADPRTVSRFAGNNGSLTVTDSVDNETYKYSKDNGGSIQAGYVFN